jgi:hypothetical protein
MAKNTKRNDPSAAANEFSEPIIIPFQGMIKTANGNSAPYTFLGSSDQPTLQDLMFEGFTRQVEKLFRLARYHGLDVSNSAHCIVLALRVALDHHPGFKVVYDDDSARTFYRLYGFTPVYPLKGKKPKVFSETDHGWPRFSKLLTPELLAMLMPRGRKRILTIEEICEAFVVAADEKMKLRTNQLTRNQRTATLVRRVTKGRNL